MSKIEDLIAVMARLREPENGCPWDLAQSFDSLVPFTLEEAYELADAIAQADMPDIQAELGDLLYQIIFYSRLAEEQGAFDFSQVVNGIVEKLIRRHPHVFDESSAGHPKQLDAEGQNRAWESEKTKERQNRKGFCGALQGVAMALPALTRAVKLQRRASRVGFDWTEMEGVFDKILEELDEVRAEIYQRDNRTRIEDEIGDLLFASTNLARHAGIDPEAALRGANQKFERRFAAMEALLQEQGTALTDMDAAGWDNLWDTVKINERLRSPD